MYISDELVDDSSEINIVNFIVQLFSEEIGNEEDRVITAGNGTTEPTGYSVATVGTITCSGNLDFDDIINLEFALPKKYYPNAKFYAHKNNIREMRKLKDSDSRYLWQDPVSAMQPATLHGFPVIEDNNLGEDKIYFGDLKKAYRPMSWLSVMITEKAVNCWKLLLNRTISNQALPVMA